MRGKRLVVSHRVLSDPRGEVVGLVGQRAQATGSNVQKVFKIGGAVSDALAEFGSRFDDDHAYRSGYGPKEVGRRQDPGGAPADDANDLGSQRHTPLYPY
jgi:hypothetical protein